MFNEKSPVWIKIYKVLVILAAAAILIGGVFWGINEASYYSSYYYSRFTDYAELALYVAIAVAAAGVEFVLGMLSVNFLSNVQTIRERVEELAARPKNDPVPPTDRMPTPRTDNDTSYLNISI